MCDDCINDLNDARRSMASVPVGTQIVVACPTCRKRVFFVKLDDLPPRRTWSSLVTFVDLVVFGGCAGWLLCRAFG